MVNTLNRLEYVRHGLDNMKVVNSMLKLMNALSYWMKPNANSMTIDPHKPP